MFIFALNLGIGPLPWVINGELFPEECKSISATVSAATSWFMAFVVTKFTSDLQSALGTSGSYFLYASITAFGVLSILLTVPETKGKTQEEMRRYFQKSSASLKE